MFLTDNIMIFLLFPYRMSYPVSNNLSMGFFDYCQFEWRAVDAVLPDIAIKKTKNKNVVPASSLTTRVGYRLNFIDSDSAYRFRFFSIPSFDSNVIK